jgi:tetratricopeptide (TPR) repeat protein/tRNA A-37 threonylcarbamoyl transferase component Bud32
MDEERLRRISTLVDSTFDLSLKELRSFLDRECPDDPGLRAEVERRVLERSTITRLSIPVPPRLRHTLDAGDIIADRYRIIRLIGRGGMGEVYEAHDQLLNENVALKTLREDLAGEEAVLERFQQEIALSRKVTHPNVCRIFEVGIHRSASHPAMLFFAMELLQGQTLADRLHAGRLTRDEAFPIAIQLAEGLQAAHQAGIVHADFKSANVILVQSNASVRAVITDFGVARLEAGNTVVDETRSLHGHDTIRVAGTLAYMSPEQLSGDRVTTASDIYSFGIVLFEMACGQRPFDDADVIKSAMLRVSGPPASARSHVPALDERWHAAITRCLQREPGRRFRSAGDLASWFRDARWWDVRHWTRLDRIRAATAAVLVLTAVIAGWIWSQRSYQPPAEAQRAYALGVNALYSMTYETARKALEQSVAIDPSFALAHASLARAYDELDYTDRAKDAMLRAVAAAQESRLSPADDRKLRALQFMVSRDYERAAPIVKELEADARIADRPAAALESGWLAQQMENTDAAAAAYQRALTLDPSYAAAKLRLGFLFGRQGGKDEQALAAFGEAEGLYRTAGNIEGVTQTLLERANLLDRRNREKEAMPMIEDALTMARAVGNRYQEVRLRFIQATAVRDLGDTARAAMLVREAIDAALAENMDNLAANGQIDLGNLHLRAKQLELAEPVFRRALDIARRAKVARIAARAQASLGALLEQLHRPAEATPLMEAALLFYREAGYRRESVQAATVLGGLHRLAGESDKAIQVLTDALPLAVQLEDQRVEAQIHERLADSLSDRGSWSAAIDEYERASQLYGSTVSGQTARENAARLRAQIGTNVNR